MGSDGAVWPGQMDGMWSRPGEVSAARWARWEGAWRVSAGPQHPMLQCWAWQGASGADGGPPAAPEVQDTVMVDEVPVAPGVAAAPPQVSGIGVGDDDEQVLMERAEAACATTAGRGGGPSRAWR